MRIGGGHRAEPVNAEAGKLATTEVRRQPLLVDSAYREWARNRGDVEKLRQLQVAIGGCLEGLADTVHR